MKRLLLFAVALFGVAIFMSVDVIDAFGQSRDIWGRPVRRGFQPPNLIHLRAAAIFFSGLTGFVFGWFMSAKAARVRKILLIIIAAILLVVTLADNGWLGWGLTPFVSLAAFMCGLGYWLRGSVSAFADRLSTVPTTFGSSTWATFKEIALRGMISVEGFRLGFFPDGSGVRQPLSYDSDRHMIISAPNRSGKGTCSIIPNLLTYKGSVIVIDPKGENAMITARARAKMGQEVYVLDPFGICEDVTGDVSHKVLSARFNPIDWLKAGDVEVSDNSLILADALIIMMGGDHQFWDEEAKGLLLGVMLLVALDPSEEGKRHLGRVRDLLLLDGKDLTSLFKTMLNSPHPVIRSAGARCLQKEEKMLANVLASVQAQTHFLDSPRLRDNLSASDFDFADVKHKAMSIFVVLPADKLESHGRWLRLLVQQALTVNARNIEQKPKHPVLFILDEMPALGKLAMVQQAFGLMAGFGIQICGVVQDLSQLKRIYGDGWETFISNAGVIQYFGSRDQFTADYFSKLCGVTTTWDWSTAVARAFGVSRGKDTTSSQSTTTTDTVSGKQRQLAYADELMRLPSDKQLVLVENMNPIIADKQPWFKNPKLKNLGVNLHKRNAK